MTLGRSLNLARPVFSSVKWVVKSPPSLGPRNITADNACKGPCPLLVLAFDKKSSESTLHRAAFAGKKSSATKIPRKTELLGTHFSDTF